jgi:hypothetical protein
VEQIPTKEWVAELESIRDAGTITLVTFKADDSSIQLVGDSRMLQPLYDYFGKLVTLHVRDFDDWTWSPLEAPNDPPEDE